MSESVHLLVVTQARYGVENVVSSLLSAFATRDDVDPTYLTIATHEAPDGIERVPLLEESRLRRYEDHRLRYLGYAVLDFWRRAYGWLVANHDDYDVVWLHAPRLFALAPGAIRDKLLVTYHNHLLSTVAGHYDVPWSLYYRAFGRVERRGLRRLADARYTVVNPAVVDELVDAGVGRDRVRYVENGVDADRFRPDRDPTDVVETYDLPTDRPLLLFLGRLKGQKRPALLVDRFADVSDALDGDVALAIAGKGARGDAAREAAAANGLTNVHFLGYVPEEHKPALYVAADYYVLASSYEGSPLALYEALASGTPAIVSPLAGTEFVADADCGLVVDFDDDAWSTAAARRIAAYITTEDDHPANARRYAETHLDWSARAAEYHEEFERILQ